MGRNAYSQAKNTMNRKDAASGYLESIFQIPFQFSGGAAASFSQRLLKTRLGPSPDTAIIASNFSFASLNWADAYNTYALS
jgi:hypothetical protein